MGGVPAGTLQEKYQSCPFMIVLKGDSLRFYICKGDKITLLFTGEWTKYFSSYRKIRARVKMDRINT